jgi:hypothetical protein
MAKSGHRISQCRHILQFSGWATATTESALQANTHFGQNSTHIPQFLQRLEWMTTEARFLIFCCWLMA